MWVTGDLKDQLGISRRKPKKNHKSESALEAAPMFLEQHNRSTSEFSTGHNNYEPASLANTAPPRQMYPDTPPMSETVELLPTGVQYAHVRTNPIDEHSLSPLPVDPRQQQSISPNPSYYSASDLPPSSPLPSPKYQYPSGEVTSTPPSRRTSVAASRTTSVSARGPPQTPMPTTPLPPQPPQPHSPALLVPGPYIPKDSAAYEMQVRSGQSGHVEEGSGGGSNHGHVYPRSASEASYASYATAADEFWAAEDGAGGSVGGHLHPPTQPQLQPQPPTQSQSHPQDGSDTPYPQRQHYLGDDEDDRETVTGHHRPVSEVSTWEGGRAL